MNIIPKCTQFLILMTAMCSCNSNPDLIYENNKEVFQQAVKCLQANHRIIFSNAGNNTSVSVYNSEKNDNIICNSIFEKQEMSRVNIVSYSKDSTVSFYLKPMKAIKERQIIFFYSLTKERLDSKLTKDMKILSNKGGGWYEAEKILSLAN